MYLCIDIGGTKTLIALLDNRGKLLHSIKFPTVFSQTEFYKNLLLQLRANFSFSSIKAISVAMPGIVHKNRCVWLGNLPWQDFDIAKLLHADFKLPVYVENDANLAALAEAGHNQGRSLYFTFSTGIGGGVIENGSLVKRYRDFEPGHNLYTFANQEQEWEDFASAGAIREHFGKLVEDIQDPAAWQEIVQRILTGLVPLTISLKPERIIFGGPLGLALDHYRNSLRKQLRTQLKPSQKLPRLFKAKYGHYSVIYGCYYYAKLQERSTN